MKQAELNRQVARQLGETISEIERRGFQSRTGFPPRRTFVRLTGTSLINVATQLLCPTSNTRLNQPTITQM